MIREEDTISRQTVLDTISELNAISFYEAQEDSKECYYEIKKAIEQLQPVVSKQKRGHWIECKDRYDIWYKCSECEKEYDKHYISHIKYCPNCGAKMNVEE